MAAGRGGLRPRRLGHGVLLGGSSGSLPKERPSAAGGSLALVWNRPDPEGSSEGFPKALEDAHRHEAPELAPERQPSRLDREPDKAGEIERSGFFERPEERHYRFGVAHDAESYLRFLGTSSSHRSLDEETRRRLFAAVGRLIDEEYGGRVIEGYRSELYVSRKR